MKYITCHSNQEIYYQIYHIMYFNIPNIFEKIFTTSLDEK
jgi:hypothetical protein